MNYTSIKQSKKLLELGLNPETADMYWGYDDHYTTTPKEKDYSIIADSLNPSCGWDNVDPYLIPCWSFGALLDIINSNNLVYDISNDKNREFEILVYSADYIEQELKFYHTEHTVVDMVVWLLKNGYIKTEKK